MDDTQRAPGYAKPPESGKFRTGDGRSRGHRPKGSKNKKTLAKEAIADALLKIPDAPHEILESGTRKRMSRIEIAWTRLNNMAASKDDRAAIKLLLDEYHKLQKIASATKQEPYPFTDF